MTDEQIVETVYEASQFTDDEMPNEGRVGWLGNLVIRRGLIDLMEKKTEIVRPKIPGGRYSRKVGKRTGSDK